MTQAIQNPGIEIPRFSDLYMGGTWKPSQGGNIIELTSPLTEKVFATSPAASTTDVDDAVKVARQAFATGPWPRMTVKERVQTLRRLRDVYAARSAEISQLVTAEMGSPVSHAEVVHGRMPLAILDYYLELGSTWEIEERRGNSVVRQEPAGVVGAIVPWNAPQSLLMLKLIPALIAGCTVVAKPSSETPLDALVLASLFDMVGLPPGVVSILPGRREIGEHLISHKGVDRVAFTGSTAAGRRIGGICGEGLRRFSLELGGKSAAIILDDADIPTVAESLRHASFENSGQVCFNQTRILAPRSRYTEAVAAMAHVASTMTIGDPTRRSTQIGPLVSSKQRDRVEEYIRIGIEEGAQIAYGGGRPADLPTGWFVEPTVFCKVDNSMKIAQEEIFGPVVAVIPYDSDDDAVAIANDSAYGLGGGVWTSDVERGMTIARRIRTGRVSVNGADSGLVAPFGGFKDSGIGREAGPEGLLAYMELKSIAYPAASG